MQQSLHKVLALVDMDAFYSQVEVRQHPELRGKPVGVVQYNPYGNLETRRPDENRIQKESNGSLIAVSYEARAQGVKRNMRGDQARAVCPDITLVQVPTAHGKADLTLYRSEGARVLHVLARLAKTERASIDECYLDLTEEAQRRLEACGGVPPMPCNPEQVHVMEQAGYVGAAAWWQRPPQAWQPGERLLACAAAAVADLRAAVLAELGYSCSAGIAHTKLMAKLCAGLHKPAQQTVLPGSAVPALLGPLPISKLKGLGGKFGEQVMSELGIETVGELAATPLSRLESLFGDKDAQWLAGLARGVTDDSVEERRLAKSVSCGKTFRGRHALRDLGAVHTWMLELGGELSERLEAEREDNNRVPQLLTVNFGSQVPWAKVQGGEQAGQSFPSTSRSCQLRKPTPEAIADDATALVRRWAAEQGSGWSLSSLYLGASNFVPVQSAASAITRFFKPAPPAGQPAAQQPVQQQPVREEEQQQQQEQGVQQEQQQPEQHEQLERQQPAQQGQQQEQKAAQEGQQWPQPYLQHVGQRQQQPGQPQAVWQEQQKHRQEQQPQQQQQPMMGQPEPPCSSGSAGGGQQPANGTAPSGSPVLAHGRQQQQGGGTWPNSSGGERREAGSAPASMDGAGSSRQAQAGEQWPQQQQQGQWHGTEQQGGERHGQERQEPEQQGADKIDESVLAELPLEMQREIRAEMRTQQMMQRFEQRRTAGKGGGPGAGGAKRPASAGRGSIQRGGAAPAGTQRIDAFLKGKRPKK